MVIRKTNLDPYIGKLLTNRYLIRDLIGKGGMGRVYLAEDAAKGGVPVAVKILSLHLASVQLSQRFAREIMIGTQLGRRSNHIVQVLSYGITEDKVPFYVMEYLQGNPMQEVMNGQPLPIATFLQYSYQICTGLYCAHQGINVKGEIIPVVHRDIKPANIFITKDSRRGETIKILDFGIAKFLSERPGMSLTDGFIGNLAYSSPEHMEGCKQLDVRSDIYSLGVLMFEMLAGKKPLQIDSNSFGDWYQAHRFQKPQSLATAIPNLKLPQELQNLVMSCLAKEVAERPQSVSQVLQTLELVKQKLEGNSINLSKSRQRSLPVQLVPVIALSEEACRRRSWPKNKPIASIVFPHLLPINQGSVTTIWAMLPKAEIHNNLESHAATEFIAEFVAYPMLLWATVLYNDENSSPRWLSSFFDLKDPRGQQIIRILATTGYYHLLFFAQEEPNRCAHVMTLTITASQRQQLLDWLELSQKSTALGSPHDSKTLLRATYEKKKPDILQKLMTHRKKNQAGVRGLLSKLLNKWMYIFPRC